LNQHFRQRPFPAGNPLANALVVIVGIIVISLSLALGFIVFLGIAGFLLATALVVGLRNWFLGRRLASGAKRSGPGSGDAVRSRYVIEGEYLEVRPSDRHRDGS